MSGVVRGHVNSATHRIIDVCARVPVLRPVVPIRPSEVAPRAAGMRHHPVDKAILGLHPRRRLRRHAVVPLSQQQPQISMGRESQRAVVAGRT